ASGHPEAEAAVSGPSPRAHGDRRAVPRLQHGSAVAVDALEDHAEAERPEAQRSPLRPLLLEALRALARLQRHRASMAAQAVVAEGQGHGERARADEA